MVTIGHNGHIWTQLDTIGLERLIMLGCFFISTGVLSNWGTLLLMIYQPDFKLIQRDILKLGQLLVVRKQNN